MNALPQIESITRLQKNHTGILELLANGPVIPDAAQQTGCCHGFPDQWDSIAKRLQMLETVAGAPD